MENTWKNKRTRVSRLLAILLVCALFAALPQATALAVDLEQTCGVKILPAGSASGYLEDLTQNAYVVVDLYKVADAASVPGYDIYSLTMRSDFTGLTIPDAVTNADWQDLAQAAFDVVREKALAPAVSGAAVDTAITLSSEEQDVPGGPGLYLVIARGRDLTAEEDYITTIKDEADHEKLVTVAYSDLYQYVYEPQLIALPTKAAVDVLDETGAVIGTEINTANPGDWIYNPTIALKPERLYRMGDLEISKTLEGYIGTEEAAFIFTIEAEWPNLNDNTKTDYFSNSHTFFFSADGTQTYKIEQQIPVGVEVKVTEVYSGAHYTLSFTDQEQTVTIAAEDTVKAAFTNVFDKTVKGGHGIENHFEHDGSTWRWVQRRAST
ncbi:MAG: hypothetical protein IJ179_08195 [Oscillospiraceae bacterium]|nr:hypothetical protein [Oscillospiraceae bacterium]